MPVVGLTLAQARRVEGLSIAHYALALAIAIVAVTAVELSTLIRSAIPRRSGEVAT
jgi:hypothetical protein